MKITVGFALQEKLLRNLPLSSRNVPDDSRHICLGCKKKLDNIVSKVLELRAQWKKNEKAANQEPAVIRVKRMLSNENTRESARARLDFPEQVSYNYS